MTRAYVIDSSVAIKWVITEKGTGAALDLRSEGTVFHAPDLIVPETNNVLWKKVRLKEITQTEAELACQALQYAKVRTYATEGQSLIALQMAINLDHPVYDTTYLALAKTLGLPVVTADKKLINKITSTKTSVFPEILPLT